MVSPAGILWRRSWAVSSWWAARWTSLCRTRSRDPPLPCSSSCLPESTRWRTWRNTVLASYFLYPQCCSDLKLSWHFGIFQMSRKDQRALLSQPWWCQLDVGVWERLSELITVSRLSPALLLSGRVEGLLTVMWGVSSNTRSRTPLMLQTCNLSFNNSCREKAGIHLRQQELPQRVAGPGSGGGGGAGSGYGSPRGTLGHSTGKHEHSWGVQVCVQHYTDALHW